MDTSADAPHREVSVEVAEVTLQLAWWGSIVTVLLAWLCARLLPTRPIREAVREFVGWLSKSSSGAYAFALTGISFGLSAFTGRFLYKDFFTNVDEIASAIHARYLASGLLGAPIADAPEAWLIPNTLMVAEASTGVDSNGRHGLVAPDRTVGWRDRQERSRSRLVHSSI
jgi:hypothetical protein